MTEMVTFLPCSIQTVKIITPSLRDAFQVSGKAEPVHTSAVKEGEFQAMEAHIDQEGGILINVHNKHDQPLSLRKDYFTSRVDLRSAGYFFQGLWQYR